MEGPPAQGLVHISQLQDTRVNDVSDVVNVGDEVKVRVLKVDVENNKMSLSMRKPQVKADLSAFAALSDEVFIEGVVKTLTNFGAFVEVKAPTGDAVAQGLLHISQISENRVEDPAEELEVDQEVQVRVLSCDTDTNKMSLSLLQKKPEEEGF